MIERLVKYAVVGYGAGVVFAVLLFDTLAVQGQMLKPIVGGGYSAGGGGAFQGMLDVQSGAKGCWGTIACSTATRGTAAIQLCDTAGANCSDASSDGTTGIVSSTQTRGSACGSTPGVDACTIHIVYDKSGLTYCGGGTVACNFTVGTTANYPYFIPNAIGSIPAIKCVGPTRYLAANTPFNAQPTSMVAGVRVDVSPGGGNYAPVMNAGNGFDNPPAGVTMGFSNATIDALYNAGSSVNAPPAVSTGTFYSVIGTQAASGSSGTMSVNGSTGTGTVGTNGTVQASLLLQMCTDNNATGRGLTASILQMAFYTADISSGVATLTSNMRTNGGY